MEKSNLAKHIQLFRKLVSNSLSSISFGVSGYVILNSKSTADFLDNRLPKPLNSLIPVHGC